MTSATDLPIRILTTGGTIDKVYFDAKSAYDVGEPLAGEVLRQAHATVPFVIEPLMRKDSLELTDADRATIRAAVCAGDARRVIITHGTDTMALTGQALAGIADRTVVLVGALLPARFRENDAIFNLGFAVAAVQLLPPGVYLAMNGRIFDPWRVRKDRDLNQFVELPASPAV
jgi:L-asparaginase